MRAGFWFMQITVQSVADLGLTFLATANPKKEIPSAANKKTAQVEAPSMKTATTLTPTDWPMNNTLANSATAAPRACGAICVAWVCSVLCSM